MPGVEDWIGSPLELIQRINDQAAASEVQHNVEDFFRKKVDACGYAEIPSLNDTPLHQLKTNSLVRYRCMVQDMFDPEFYLGQYAVRDLKSGSTSTRLGMYRDIALCGPNEEILMQSAENRTMDRQTLYCVPIPGESSWAKQCYAQQGKSQEIATTSSNQRSKRRAEDDDMDDVTHTMNGVTNNSSDVTTSSSDVTTKTEQTGESMDTVEDVQSSGDAAKKVKTGTDSKEKVSSQPDLNFPLPGEKGPACLVKVYDTECSYKVNEMVEFIGVLSNDPAMVDFPADSEAQSAFANPADAAMDVAEQQVRSPPPSLVPRLHVVLKTSSVHSNQE